LEGAVQIDPAFGPPYFALALLARLEERWTDAIDNYEKFLARSPTPEGADKARAGIKELRALIAEDQEPGGRQRRQYRDAVAAARALITARRFKDARAAAGEAHAIDPNGWEAYAVVATAF